LLSYFKHGHHIDVASLNILTTRLKNVRAIIMVKNLQNIGILSGHLVDSKKFKLHLI